MRQFDRSKFDHIGIVTTPEAAARAGSRPRASGWPSPRDHPYNVEFLRFAPDTRLRDRSAPSPVAYRVDDLEQARGHEIVLEPFDASGTGFASVAFVQISGALVELMQYANPNEEGWF